MSSPRLTNEPNAPRADEPALDARLVCFDLGGVLVRICHSWDEACKSAGMPVHPVSDHRLADIHGLVHQFQTGRVDHARFAQQYARVVDGAYTPDQVSAVIDAWLLGEYDGTCELIDALHERGIETAALSNTNDKHWRIMADYPAFRRIRRPLASHLLQLAKPDPAIYRAAEAAFSVRGEQIIFFDDLPENVDAARQAGWNARRIDPHHCTATQMTEHLTAAGILRS